MKAFISILLPWIFPTCVRCGCIPSENELGFISTDKMKFVATSADNKHLWGISPQGKPYYRTGSSNWQSVPLDDKLRKIFVSEDGDKIWAINEDGKVLFREGGINGSFDLAPGSQEEKWTDLYVTTFDKELYAVNGLDGNKLTKELYFVNGLDERNHYLTKGWSTSEGWIDTFDRDYGSNLDSNDGEVNLINFSSSIYGRPTWGVDDNDNVWYNEFGATLGWEKVSGKFKSITVSADGQHVWGTNYAGIIFYRNGKYGYWRSVQSVRSRANQIAVSGDGSWVYGVTRNNDVFSVKNGYSEC